MDWLSRFLGMVQVSGKLELRCLYGAPWRVVYDTSPTGEMPYHVVLDGSAVIESVDAPPQQLLAGDIALLPHGSAHVLHDRSGEAPVPAAQRDNLNVILSENAGTGERLDMLCGRFVLASPHDRLARAYLPAVLVVRGAGSNAAATPASRAQLARLIGLMRDESMVAGLGGGAMLNAYSAALFALTLRLAIESNDAPVGLLALAAHPRLAPALSAMLKDPSHPWTLPALARLCHMSRATLARRFQQGLGRSASELLADIRISLAVNALKDASASTDAVAEQVGYQSASAFRLAFRQRTGMSPSDWRRAARQDPDKPHGAADGSTLRR